jgi:general secretion pathway protein G
MMVVLAVIGILTATLLPQIGGFVERARQGRAQSEVNSTVLAMYSLLNDTGFYPYEPYLLVPGAYPPGDTTGTGLNGVRYGIIATEGNYPNWNGPYLMKAIGLDPWQREYQYDGGDAGEWDSPGDASYCSLGRNGVIECVNLADLNCTADDVILYLKR